MTHQQNNDSSIQAEGQSNVSPAAVRGLYRLIDVLEVRFLPDTPSNAIVAGALATSCNNSDASSHFRAQADGVHCDEVA